MHSPDFHFMQQCLRLAQSGYGRVNPNPMVGAVIVKDGAVIAEGVHRRFGGDHAELDALKRAGNRAAGATLYVNLEPCNHHGKTPPCTAAIMDAGIERVVYGAEDPNPGVTGNGSRRLKQSGIQVEKGVLHDEAVTLNEQFYFAMRANLPFVILKAAMTLDGYIADSRSKSKWITGEAAREYVQYLRRGSDAILAGANTVRDDNPRLTVHGETDRQPFRIILDGALNTPLRSKVYNDEFRSRTIVICLQKNKNRAKIEQLEKKGVTVLQYKSENNRLSIRRVLRGLQKRKINSLLVEGGGDVFRQFIESKLYARAMFFIAPKMTGGGTKVVSGIDRPLRNAYRLYNITTEIFGEDVLIKGDTELYGKYVW